MASVCPVALSKVAAPGSIADIRARLLLWCQRTESGLARVELTSEEARRRVTAGLRPALVERGIAFHEVDLPTGMDATRLVRDLLWRLETLSPGVVSVNGFAAALPDQPEALAAALYLFNFNRERLARPRQRQIWWMPRHLAEAFLRIAPDLDSWFLVKLQLTETPATTASITASEFTQPDTAPRLSPEAARQQAEDYLARLERGREQGFAAPELEEKLLFPAIAILRQAGLEQEAAALEQRFHGERTAGEMTELTHGATPGQTADIAEVKSLLARADNLYGSLRFSEAESLYRQALRILECAQPEAPELATALNNLAQLLQATHRLAEAEPLMRRALALDEQRFGLDHPDVARDLNNLAGLLQDTHRLAEAEPLMRRALAISEQRFGPDHPDVARDLNDLATLLQATHRLAEAEPLMRRALAIDEQRFGLDHPDVATDLSNLAQLLRDTDRLAEAEPLMRRALAIDEQCFGLDHPTVAIRLNNLAQLLQATHRLAEAEPLMRRALAIDEQCFGLDHPTVAIRLHNLAVLLRDTDRLAEAEPLMRRALAINEQRLGPDHPKVALAFNNLARLLQATHRLAEAEPLMRRALSILRSCKRTTGYEHPHLNRVVENYRALLEQMGRNPEEIKAQLDATGISG